VKLKNLVVSPVWGVRRYYLSPEVLYVRTGYALTGMRFERIILDWDILNPNLCVSGDYYRGISWLTSELVCRLKPNQRIEVWSDRSSTFSPLYFLTLDDLFLLTPSMKIAKNVILES
jgi:hypothetical protein